MTVERNASPIIRVEPGEESRVVDVAAKYPGGCQIVLSTGHFKFNSVLYLPPNTRVIGSGVNDTTIELLPHSNSHLFSNVQKKDAENFHLEGFRIIGNSEFQEKPQGHKPLTFSCAMYFKGVDRVTISNVEFFDIRQTAMHFNSSKNILIKDCFCERLGWSGLSTSNAFNLWADGLTIRDAGLDHRHSAIHLDGGIGNYCFADVAETTGNGIMLDSTFGPLSHVRVRGRATTSKRGVSLSGSGVHALENVAISGEYCGNREVGIMVSNASHVAISDAKVKNNGDIGILFQGRNGGNYNLVYDCEVSENPVNIAERHVSKENWVFDGSNKLDLDNRINDHCLNSSSERAMASLTASKRT